MLKAQQIELKWTIPQNLSVRDFRRQLGRALAERPIPDGWDRFFNHGGETPAPSPALFRFFAKRSDSGSKAGVTIIGDEACRWGCTNLFQLLDAMKSGLASGAPEINNGTIYWERRPERIRAVKVVVRSKKIKRGTAALAPYHTDPILLAPFLQQIVAEGVNRQAAALNLENPALEPDEIQIERIDELGCQPVEGPGGQYGMLPRISQAIVRMPVKLIGSWHVGPLQTYGNGQLHRIIEEEHVSARSEQGAIIRQTLLEGA